MSCDSATVTRRVLVRPPPSLPKISPIEIAPICAPGMPGISNSGMPPPVACTSISISLSLSSPARSRLRKASLVEALAFSPTSALTTRSSAASCARARTSLRFRSRVCVIATSTRSRIICSTSRPTYPTSVNLVASTLMKGAPASLARRREISVFPTPVGPIIRMFFGSTSSRSFSSSCRRRQRLRSATATARLASTWPMMKRSSSDTISRGEKSVMNGSELFHGDVAVGKDADVRGNLHGLAHDRLGIERTIDQRASGGERVVAPGTDSHDAGLGFQHITGAGEQQRDLRIGDDHHRFQPAQIAIGAPVLRQLDRGAGELPGILLELGFQPLEQRKGVRRGACKSADDVALAEAADLFGIGLDHRLTD